MKRLTSAVAALAALACSGELAPRLTLADSITIRSIASAIIDSTLANPDPSDWPQHGRTRDEQRHSPLRQVDTTTVQRLGIAWSYDLGAYERMEATPIVVGGVLYATGRWNEVHAVDAASGQPIWTFDPQVHRRTGTTMCCGAVNRGVAVYQGRVYVGTLDGRLIALDAGTGARLWQVQTVDTASTYSITGAPRVGRGISNRAIERVVMGPRSQVMSTSGANAAYPQHYEYQQAQRARVLRHPRRAVRRVPAIVVCP